MSAQNTKPAFELELTRVIDAPRARVYEAWTMTLDQLAVFCSREQRP